MIRRLIPWLVLGGLVAAGAWILAPVLPLAAHGPIAAWGIATIVTRTAVLLGAVAAGVFALSRTEFSATGDPVSRRRRSGLRALGAASLLAGAAGIVGPLLGVGIAAVGGYVALTALLGGAATLATHQLASVPLRRLEDGRVRTPAP